jgi:hypothetical protein
MPKDQASGGRCGVAYPLFTLAHVLGGMMLVRPVAYSSKPPLSLSLAASALSFSHFSSFCNAYPITPRRCRQGAPDAALLPFNTPQPILFALLSCYTSLLLPSFAPFLCSHGLVAHFTILVVVLPINIHTRFPACIHFGF